MPAWDIDMQTETGRAHEKKGKASKKTAPGRTGTAACFALFGASLVQGIISPHMLLLLLGLLADLIDVPDVRPHP